jgi:hypothetical protein
MPELIIKYKSAKVKEALIDFSKYLDFIIVGEPPKSKAKKVLLGQISRGLKDVKNINQGKQKGISIQDMLNEK